MKNDKDLQDIFLSNLSKIGFGEQWYRLNILL